MQKKICLALFLVVLARLILFVLHVPTFTATPHPARSYEEACQKFSVIQKQEAKLPLSPEGHSQLFVHATTTERVFVLLHGLTSYPEQFVPLGKILFDRGANVVILRARHAGYANIFNKEQTEQSGQDLIDQAAESLDIAVGLSQHITIVSASAGSLGATWTAQHREGIDQVLLISPFFGPYGWPLPALDVATAFLLYFPNFYICKNDPQNDQHDAKHVYPGYGSQCIAKTLELSRAIRSFQGPLQVQRMDILFSGADHVANGQLTKKVAQKWSAQNPGKVFEYEFPASLNIAHSYSSKMEQAYPMLLKTLGYKE